MNPVNMRLADVPLSTSCIIKEILGDGIDKRRLFDLGFFEGSKVAPLYESPGGGTMAYFVKGTVIALRKEEALRIITEPLRGEVAKK